MFSDSFSASFAFFGVFAPGFFDLFQQFSGGSFFGALFNEFALDGKLEDEFAQALDALRCFDHSIKHLNIEY